MEVDELAPRAPLVDDEVLFLEVGGETAVLVTHHRREGHDIHSRSERRLRRLTGWLRRRFLRLRERGRAREGQHES